MVILAWLWLVAAFWSAFAGDLLGAWLVTISTAFFAMYVGLSAILMGLQTFWLLPELTARMETIMAGEQPPSSSHHEVYAWLGIVKLLGLIAMAGLAARRLLRVEL